MAKYLYYWIFPNSAFTISCTKVQPLTDEDLCMPDVQRHIVDIDRAIKMRFRDKADNEDTDTIRTNMEYEELEGLADCHDDADPYETESEMPEQDDIFRRGI